MERNNIRLTLFLLSSFFVLGLHASAQNKIVGGSPSSQGAWPSTVAVMYNSGNPLSVVNSTLTQGCGGSLIAPDVVLTAAHCIMSDSGFGVIDAHPPYSVVIGRTDLNDKSVGQEFIIKEIVIHPLHQPDIFKPKTLDNDIALLFLEGNASNPNIPTVTQQEWRNLRKGTSMTVTGWGDTEENGRYAPSIMHEVDVRFQDTRKCKKNLINFLSRTPVSQRNTKEYKQLKARVKSGLTRNMFCAGINRGGKDSCQGDSGGPIYSTINGVLKQVGIVSWGYGCGRRKLPGVYTKLSNYEEWIAQEISKRQPPTPQDITIVMKKNTGSGFVEFHRLNGLTNYSSYSQHQATSLPTSEINKKDDFMFGEIDFFSPNLDEFLNESPKELLYFERDRGFNPIVFGVFNGDTSYQNHSFTYHQMPMSPQRRQNAEIISTRWDYDSFHDMVIIDRDDGLGRASISVQSSYLSIFEIQLLRATLPTGALNKNIWDIRLGHYDNDLVPDLFLLRRYGTGAVEVHVLSGNSNYQEWILHKKLFLHELTTPTMELHIADYNRDGRSDLYFINRGVTGSGNTEIHVFDGATNYQTFLLNGVSPLPPLWDDEAFQFIFD